MANGDLNSRNREWMKKVCEGVLVVLCTSIVGRQLKKKIKASIFPTFLTFPNAHFASSNTKPAFSCYCVCLMMSVLRVAGCCGPAGGCALRDASLGCGAPLR